MPEIIKLNCNEQIYIIYFYVNKYTFIIIIINYIYIIYVHELVTNV